MARSFGTYSVVWWRSACNGYLVCVAAFLYFLLFFLNICLNNASTLFMCHNSSPSDICDDNDDNDDVTASLYFLTCWSVSMLFNNIIIINNIIYYCCDMIFICRINIDGLLTDAKVYTDPLAYNPSRWLTTDSDALQRMEAQLLSFGSGPRVCPGKALALRESLITLVLLANDFDISLACSPADIHRVLQFVSCADKMPCYVTSRQFE